MFDVIRFLLPDLMAARGMTTSYQLAKASKGAINATTAYRLVEAGYTPKRIDIATLDVLCEVLEAKPADFFERDKPRKR
jgi:DNA-binding Xre family transcriptional regulator